RAQALLRRQIERRLILQAHQLRLAVPLLLPGAQSIEDLPPRDARDPHPWGAAIRVVLPELLEDDHGDFLRDLVLLVAIEPLVLRHGEHQWQRVAEEFFRGPRGAVPGRRSKLFIRRRGRADPEAWRRNLIVDMSSFGGHVLTPREPCSFGAENRN